MRRIPAKKRRIRQDDDPGSESDRDAPFVVTARTLPLQAGRRALARPSSHVQHPKAVQQKRPLEGAPIAPVVSSPPSAPSDPLRTADLHGTGRDVAKLVCVTASEGEQDHPIALGDANLWIGRHKDARIVVRRQGGSGSQVDPLHARVYAVSCF